MTEPGDTADAGARQTERKRIALSEEFSARTLPHLNAVYADAFCLVGGQEDAASLVVEAYLRAFWECEQSKAGRVPAHLRTRRVLAWLYGHLHAAFCDEILAHAASPETPIGG